MGLAKQQELENHDRRFSQPKENFVCNSHIDDKSIAEYIEKNSEEGICSYCDVKAEVISLDLLVKFISNGINYFYTDINDAGVYYDKEDDDYPGANATDSYDLLQYTIGLEVDDEVLFDDIAQCFSNTTWCQKAPYSLSEHEELIYDWDNFKQLVKHKIRYSFFKTKHFPHAYRNDMSYILDEIAASIDSLNLFGEIDEREVLYRCRQHGESEDVKKFSQIVSPPDKFAITSNRMSPAGVSMFYGAFDTNTAEQETVNLSFKESSITTGKFSVIKKINVIDFTLLPQIPSIFDETQRRERFRILFLRSFLNDLSASIKRDGKEHINYVPTQIMTEYFRYVYPDITQIVIDGIIYPSSKGDLNKCCVLFFDNKTCAEYLKLEKLSLKKLPLVK